MMAPLKIFDLHTEDLLIGQVGHEFLFHFYRFFVQRCSRQSSYSHDTLFMGHCCPPETGIFKFIHRNGSELLLGGVYPQILRSWLSRLLSLGKKSHRTNKKKYYQKNYALTCSHLTTPLQIPKFPGLFPGEQEYRRQTWKRRRPS